MKKTILINLTASLCGMLFAVQAQKIDRLYIDMPETLQPVLSRQQRTELLEYAKADMGDSITNRFGRQAHLLLLDTIGGHIRVQNTDLSRFEMKLLTPTTGDTVIAVVTTVCTPVCNSVLRFYDTRWQRRTDINVRLPKAADWLDADRIKAAGASEQNLRNMLIADFIELTIDSVRMQVRAANHTPDYLEETDREKVLPFLKDKEIVVQLTVDNEQ